MTLLNRLLGHDLATTRELLRLCMKLPDAEMDRAIDGGWGTLRETFGHMIGNIEVWTDVMLGRMVGRPVVGAGSAGALGTQLRRLCSISPPDRG